LAIIAAALFLPTLNKPGQVFLHEQAARLVKCIFFLSAAGIYNK